MPGQFEVSPIPDEMGVGTRVDRRKGVCTLIRQGFYWRRTLT